MSEESGSSARKPAGAAVMQPQVTAAIRAAAFEELAEAGYGRLSMEAVARRAGVSKPTLYRRWSTKEDLVTALISEVAIAAADPPDTGTLRGDLRALLGVMGAGLTNPLAARIIPDLLAQAVRAPALREVLAMGIGQSRRAKIVQLLHRAIARGELPETLNTELALDFIGGPLFLHVMLGGNPTAPNYLDQLTDMLLAAFGAPPT
ncbi:TetR/AcrR family transcriptional regulator [Nocardia yunnanensis]|uniref:TetR/AcrR family transcriptional regulator n=1 Tax=Nocardia yunnanensis TaxID=2382165 RepID=A0A386ZI66_9NOCA|nr:TetR/AcrR family transcriptional regulator [Nocardia yunnanensis]AYF77602.1 TetR/AcrR family transcriptional regulator [Nocardia yunnanensis]